MLLFFFFYVGAVGRGYISLYFINVSRPNVSIDVEVHPAVLLVLKMLTVQH